MGFDVGFTAVKKFKDCTLSDYLSTKRYIEWLDNPWNHEDGHYPNYEDYFNAFKEEYEKYSIPSDELVEFYRNNKEIDLFSWGGWNIGDVDSEILNYTESLNNSKYYHILVDKEELLEYIDNYVESNALTPVIPIKSITINEEDDSEILRNIDGVMLEHENCDISPYYNEDCESLYLMKEDQYYLAYQLNLFKARLELIDLSTHWVYYWRSW